MNLLTVTIVTIAAAALLGWLLSAARGTTLIYAWRWAGAAAMGIATVEFAIRLPDGLALAADAWKPARYLAAILLFCPLMSVLGSKRPHEQAWQWIVLSLWGILALPALEWLALRRAPALEISGVRGWFLLLLVGLTALHGLGTRITVAGLFLAAAQAGALWEWLPVGGDTVEPWIWQLALLASLFTSALAMRTPPSPSPSPSPSPPSTSASTSPATSLAPETVATHPNASDEVAMSQAASDRQVVPYPSLNTFAPSNAGPRPSPFDETAARDQVWRDYRDRFGTLWAFRLMERVNSAAALARWTVRLEWDGIRPITPSPHEASAQPASAPRTTDVHASPPGTRASTGLAAHAAEFRATETAATAEELGVNQTLWNLLRRFVSVEWCQARGWTPPD